MLHQRESAFGIIAFERTILSTRYPGDHIKRPQALLHRYKRKADESRAA